MPLADHSRGSMFRNDQPQRQQLANVHSSNQAHERSQQHGSRRESQSNSNNREPIRPQSQNRAREAAALKVPVPITVQPQKSSALKHQTSRSTLDEQENGSLDKVVKQEPVRRPHSQNTYQMWGQDDDESTQITTGEEGWDPDRDYSGEPTAFRRPVNPKDLNLSLSWKQEADAGRIMTGRPPLYATAAKPQRQLIGAQENDDTYSGIGDDEDEDFEDQMQRLNSETPSRATSHPGVNHQAQNKGKAPVKKTIRPAPQDERDSSPLPVIPQDIQQPPAKSVSAQAQSQQSSLTRHNEYKQQVDAIPARQERPIPVRAPDNAVSKVSGYHEASEDEQPLGPKMELDAETNKRSHAEIDYDLNDLHDKAYAELDEVPFLTDPRGPAIQPAVGAQGALPSTPQRLAALSQMRPEDQETLFRTLTDEDNEKVGQWFVHKFQDDLKKLMEARLERRKIALKYEAEAKRREKGVQVKIGDVEDELRQLRKGGGDLIQGRSVAGVGGAPKGK